MEQTIRDDNLRELGTLALAVQDADRLYRAFPSDDAYDRREYALRQLNNWMTGSTDLCDAILELMEVRGLV